MTRPKGTSEKPTQTYDASGTSWSGLGQQSPPRPETRERSNFYSTCTCKSWVSWTDAGM